MSDTTLTVNGGAAGVTARYDDMRACADGLSALAAAMMTRLDDVAAVALDPDVLEGAVLAPGTAVRVAEQTTSATVGPHGLGVAAAHLAASAVLLRGSVVAYEALDAALALAADVGEAVATVPVLALGGDMPGRWAGALLDPSALCTASWWADTGEALADNAYEHPWTVDGGVRDLAGGVAAAGSLAALDPSLGSLFAAGPAGPAGEGGARLSLSFEDAVRDLLGVGGAFGLFREGGAMAAGLGHDFAPLPPGQPLPDSLRGLLAGVAVVDDRSPDGGQQTGVLRILQVRGDDGVVRYVVEIPGTQAWGPRTDVNPLDLTSNLRLMAGAGSAAQAAVAAAMDGAGIPRDAPVLLVGHSQGGMTAAALAADPAMRARFHLADVVTAGSPVARFDVPDDVHVLSLEHTRDVVPRLDARQNPDRPTWVTVHRDADGVSSVDEVVDSVVDSHPCAVYAGTAGLVDASADPSLVRARAWFAPFLSGDRSRVRVREFALVRAS